MAGQDPNPDGLGVSGDKQGDLADLSVNRGGWEAMMPLEERGDKSQHWQDVGTRKPRMGVAFPHCFKGTALQHK